MAKALKLTSEEKSWVLYDVANSAFVLIVTTTFMPIFFKDYACAGVDSASSTATWAFTVSGASLVLAVLAPVLGAFADYKGYKKKFWGVSILLGIVFGVGLLLIGEGQWVLATILYAAASVSYTASTTFYDAFLPDVTTNERMDRVSTLGYGWGYIGSVIPFLAALGVIFALGMGPSGAISPLGMKIAFAIAVVWWGIFSIPMARGVRQRHGVESEGLSLGKAVSGAFARLWATLKDVRRDKPIFFFLLAYFFYIDGVHTIISTATAYGRDLGLSAVFLVVLVLFIQVVAWPFAIVFGRLSSRFGRKAMIFVAIVVYALVCFAAFLVPLLPTLGAKMALFWFMAFLIASSQGGIQALSRSYFASVIPPEKSAEYFGFYDVFGKFAAILGPFLLGLMTRLTGDSKWGVLSLCILFVIGGAILAAVPKVGEGRGAAE
jgi:UMF1 family MFS transporter